MSDSADELPPVPAAARPSRASDALYERARRLIPGVHPDPGQGPGPVRARRGAQVPAPRPRRHVWDVDGNEFIDFNMAIGPISLGYAHPEVDAAIRAQLEDGITFS